MTVHATPGRHVLADFHGVAAAGLSDAAALERQLLAAADAAGARVLSAHFHHFGEGAGVTGVVMLSESHISIHTWPEHGYAALDVFMRRGPARARAGQPARRAGAGLGSRHGRRPGLTRGAFSLFDMPQGATGFKLTFVIYLYIFRDQ